jgi:predicted nucleotidyltransferase
MFINVLIILTIVLKMRTIIKQPIWNILEVFYKNKNKPLHLRELSRRINLKEGSISRHLNYLLKEKILIFENEGNLKKFKIKNIKKIFTLFDIQKYEDLPYIRKLSVNLYITHLKEKPLLIILFGSTAKETFNENSDIDIITIFNKKTDTKQAIKYAENQTGIKISELQLTYGEFIDEIKMKKDNVIQAGIETGYPIYNHFFYYEVMFNG